MSQIILRILTHARITSARFLLPLFHILPIQKGSWLKVAIARLHGADVSWSAQLSPRIFLLRGKNITIGDSSSLGIDCRLIDIDEISIGSNCIVSHNVSFISGNHKLDFNRSGVKGPIKVGNSVWIGTGVSIVGPCEIGSFAIIGANSFVTGTVDAHTVVGGVPAKLIRSYQVSEGDGS